MKYELEDKPDVLALVLYGLQWFAVALPFALIIGFLLARLQFNELADQVFYMQKLLALLGIILIIQITLGHRMPLVIGPASILLVGIIASSAPGPDAVHTSIILGGALLAAAGFSGLISRLRFFFTPRIIAVILMLIAVTLAPTILKMLLAETGNHAFNFSFGILLVIALIIINSVLPGIWKSITIILALAGGSLLYFCLTGFPELQTIVPDSGKRSFFLESFDFHPGAFLSFIFCYLALTINELGSIESLGQMLKLPDIFKRIRRGTGVLGVANMAAGGLGVIGPVDYSISPGIIAASGCASRYPLILAGAGLIICAFFPRAVLVVSLIPSTVMGALMLYVMVPQLATGLLMLVAEKGIGGLNSGLTVGLPLMVGLLVAFAPPSLFEQFPNFLQPIIANGFVMGAILVILLEHVIFRKKQ